MAYRYFSRGYLISVCIDMKQNRIHFTMIDVKNNRLWKIQIFSGEQYQHMYQLLYYLCCYLRKMSAKHHPLFRNHYQCHNLREIEKKELYQIFVRNANCLSNQSLQIKSSHIKLLLPSFFRFYISYASFPPVCMFGIDKMLEMFQIY